MSLLERLSQWRASLFPAFAGAAADSETDARRVATVAVLGIFAGCVLAWFGGGLNAVWWGSASLAAGGFVGFLFGIPRVVQDSPNGDDATDSPYSQRVNTNLEQISDWLTKIIVGFGLIELRKMPTAFQSLAEYVAADSRSTPSFAGSLVIFFAVAGFFACYLLTRLYLAAAFSRADQQTFERGVEQLHADETTQIPPDIAGVIDVSPASAVSMSFLKFDKSVREATERLGLSVPARTMDAYQQLAQQGHLDASQVQTAEQLRQLRNIAVHDGDQSVKKVDAEKYVRNATTLTQQIEQVAR